MIIVHNQGCAVCNQAIYCFNVSTIIIWICTDIASRKYNGYANIISLHALETMNFDVSIKLLGDIYELYERNIYSLNFFSTNAADLQNTYHNYRYFKGSNFIRFLYSEANPRINIE